MVDASMENANVAGVRVCAAGVGGASAAAAAALAAVSGEGRTQASSYAQETQVTHQNASVSWQIRT